MGQQLEDQKTPLPCKRVLKGTGDGRKGKERRKRRREKTSG